MSNSEQSGSHPIAGTHFPWKHIAGYFLRVESFAPFTQMDGDNVGPPTLGAFGLVGVELPNPDAAPASRILSLPVEHKSDYKSLFRAHLDSGVRAKTNELVLVYEHRRGLFGSRKPCLHVAAYPTGTWQNFFEAVSRYESERFRWPGPLFLYQPSKTQAFPVTKNIFAY